jgi:alkanesulfonate monooxygenase SsuD/methylene tetrahydromethanopterin reductase-like flavin-dependent oxidoreductase (luciferase family)
LSESSRRDAVLRGARELLPLWPGIFAWGLVTGVAMVKSGLSTPEALGLSLLAYAGSAQLAALPTQRPRPPLWIAANGDRAVERAGRLGDTWMINPHARTGTIVRQLELFHSARREAGRGELTALPLMKEVFCASSREEAIRAAAPYLGAKYEAYAKWGQDDALPEDETFALPFEELLADRFVLGTPDDCLAQLAPWRELGVDTFVIRSHWPGMPVDDALASLRLLTEEVLPALRA